MNPSRLDRVLLALAWVVAEVYHSRLMRHLRTFWCLLTHGHHDLWWPCGMTGDALIAMCRHCGHRAIVDLSDLPKPKYHGVPIVRRVR